MSRFEGYEEMWNLRFHQLTEYKRAHGHCKVPRKDGPCFDLGSWVSVQRENKNLNKLSAEREAKLNAIVFSWGKTRKNITADWNTRFEQLVEYKKANGHCKVRTQDVALSRWVANQRHTKKLKNKTQMSEEREAKLNSIGFDWRCSPVASWNTRFDQLVEYNKANGDCNVRQHLSQHVALVKWVANQRRLKKTNRLSVEREAKMNSLGFEWIRPRGFARVYRQQLEERKPTHGICDVPERCRGNNPTHLRELVTGQRFGVLEKERGTQQLNTNNGIVCKRQSTYNENWDAHFRELLAYLQAHGDNNVPQGDPRNPLLARWVSEQRNDYDLKRRGEQTSLTPLREAKLDAIGFTWFVGGTDDAPGAEGVGLSNSAVRPEEARSGHKVRTENVGVPASPDRIKSG